MSGIFGGGGGGSSSSTSTSTTNIDKRQVVDAGSVGVTSDSSTVNVTASYLDGEAVDKAIDLAKSSTDGGAKNVAEVLGFAKDVLKLAGDNIGNTQKAFATATDKVGQAYETVEEMSSGQKFLVAGGLVIAGIVAFNAVKKG